MRQEVLVENLGPVPSSDQHSRVFSTSAPRVKELIWKLNGATEDLDWEIPKARGNLDPVSSSLAPAKKKIAKELSQGLITERVQPLLLCASDDLPIRANLITDGQRQELQV